MTNATHNLIDAICKQHIDASKKMDVSIHVYEMEFTVERTAEDAILRAVGGSWSLTTDVNTFDEAFNRSMIGKNNLLPHVYTVSGMRLL
jgi:hypothetical protein